MNPDLRNPRPLALNPLWGSGVRVRPQFGVRGSNCHDSIWLHSDFHDWLAVDGFKAGFLFEARGRGRVWGVQSVEAYVMAGSRPNRGTPCLKQVLTCFDDCCNW